MTTISDDAVRALLPHLRRFALGLTRDPAAADDLVQAALERVLSHWSSWRGEGSLRAWVFAILYRQFIAEQRRARRFSRLVELFTGADRHAPSAEEGALARAGLAAIDGLPTEQRALLLLVSIEGLSYKEAAEALDLPIGTVMSRLSRARAALHRAIDGEETPQTLRAVP